MADPGSSDELGFVLGIFARTNRDGTPVYSDAVLADFIPAMLLAYGVDFTALPPPVEAVMAGFARRAGIVAGMPLDAMRQAIDAYYTAHPLPSELRLEFLQKAREQRIGRGNEEVAEAFEKYMRDTNRKLEGLLSKERPETSLPAGPFAQFRASSKLEENEKKTGRGSKPRPKRR
ncbi:MAG: hypothetical protein HYV07_30790 [Deltaproteobacteria bacterium]|nr:hypothetical protein [Deltaproteobacteria bacterium]